MNEDSKEHRRALMLAHSYYPHDVRVRRFAEALRSEGWDIDALVLRGPGESATEWVDGVAVHRMPLGRRRGSKVRYALEYCGFSLYAAMWLTWAARRRRYDLVHVHTPPDFLIFSALGARWSGAKLVLDLHEVMPEFYRQKYAVSHRHWMVRLLGLIERLSMKAADAVITVNEPLRRRFLKEARAVSVILNAADERVFPYRGSNYLTGRVQPDPFSLVYHGTLSTIYGLDVAIAAVARLATRWPFCLNLYGDGQATAELKRMATHLSLGDRVRFHGRFHHAQIPSILVSAGAGVIPTMPGPMLDLSLSNKLLEMAWIGLPVIAADLPSYREYFPQNSLLTFRPGDSDSMAHTLDSFARMAHTERAGYAERVAQAANVWRWSRESQRYLDVLESLLS